jgi:hypothetical protein
MTDLYHNPLKEGYEMCATTVTAKTLTSRNKMPHQPGSLDSVICIPLAFVAGPFERSHTSPVIAIP